MPLPECWFNALCKSGVIIGSHRRDNRGGASGSSRKVAVAKT